MAIQTVNTGTVINDGTGDTIYAAMNKINSNFANVTVMANIASNTLTANVVTAGNSTLNATMGYFNAGGAYSMEQIYGSQNSSIEFSIYNSNVAGNATSDIIAYDSGGLVGGNYIDMGINGNTYNNLNWSINGPSDGYFYTSNSNLSVGTAATNYLNFFTGGSLAANERMRITPTGNVGIGNSAPVNTLSVNGTTYLGGNVSFTANASFISGSYIVGDFSNSTFASRTSFITSATNGATGVYVLPNGTNTAASIQALNNSNPTNASKVLIATNDGTDVQLVSGINGTGTYLPLSFYTNGYQQMQLTTAGALTVGNTSVTTSNTTVAPTSISVSNSTSNVQISPASINVGSTFGVNSTGIFSGALTYNANAIVGSSNNAHGIVALSNSNSAIYGISNSSLGLYIQSNTGATVTQYANATTTLMTLTGSGNLNVLSAVYIGTLGTTNGAIVNTTTITLGNSTVNTFANSTHFYSGNSTSYGFGNSTVDVLVTNGNPYFSSTDSANNFSLWYGPSIATSYANAILFTSSTANTAELLLSNGSGNATITPTTFSISNTSATVFSVNTTAANLVSNTFYLGTSNVSGHTAALANGYTTLPNGLKMLWGTLTTANSTAQVITFSTASGVSFTTNCFSLTATSNAAGTSSTNEPSIYAVNATAFTVITSNATASSINWLAIGI